MSLGTLYYNPPYARSNWLLELAEYLGVSLEGKVAPESPEFPELFPLQKTPAFISPSGFKLTESLAIVYYMIHKSTKPDFAGVTDEERATNWRWYSFITADMTILVTAVLLAKTEQDKQEAITKIKQLLKYFDDSVSNSKYLTGSTIYVCDIFAKCYFMMLKDLVMDYDEYSNITRYLDDVSMHPIFAEIMKK